MNQETMKRFWQKVDSTGKCWLWIGSKRYKGYGAFVWANDKNKVIQGRAHRFSWLIHYGEIPDGMLVLHKCDVPACVNPDHLFLGTHQDNVDDMISKGRKVNGGTYKRGNYKRGEGHHNAKLTWEIVNNIRSDKESMSYSLLSKKYALSIGHLHRIVNLKVWKNERERSAPRE